MFVGFVVLAVLAVLAIVGSATAMIGFKSKVSADHVWRDVLGTKRFKVCSFVFAFCLAFWACFDFR